MGVRVSKCDPLEDSRVGLSGGGAPMCTACGQLLEWLLEHRLCIPGDASQSPWSFVVIAPMLFLFFFFGDSIYFNT